MRKDERYYLWATGLGEERDGIRRTMAGTLTRRGIKRAYKRGLLPKGTRARKL